MGTLDPILKRSSLLKLNKVGLLGVALNDKVDLPTEQEKTHIDPA